METLKFLRNTLEPNHFKYIEKVLGDLQFKQELQIRITRDLNQYTSLIEKSPNQHMKCLKTSSFNLYGPLMSMINSCKVDFAVSYVSRLLFYNNQTIDEDVLVIYEKPSNRAI